MGVIYDNLYKKYNKSVLTTAEVASELGATTESVKKWAKNGKLIPPLPTKVGRSLQWSLKDFAKFLGDSDV